MLPLPEPVFSIATQNEGPPVKEAKPDLQGDNNSEPLKLSQRLKTEIWELDNPGWIRFLGLKHSNLLSKSTMGTLIAVLERWIAEHFNGGHYFPVIWSCPKRSPIWPGLMPKCLNSIQRLNEPRGLRKARILPLRRWINLKSTISIFHPR
jgi:hypothetical protein